MSLLHPNRGRIQEWLDSGATDEGLEEHLEHCVRCSDELEAISEEQILAEVDNVESALAELLAPPADLGERMEERIAASFQARQDLELFADLFGIGPQTTRILFEPIDPSADDS